MGMVLIKVKIMPDSPDADLDALEKKAEEIVVAGEGGNIKMEREPVAFGLNAIIVFFSRDENLESDGLLDELRGMGNVSSAEVIDYRRALG
ncbi:elongation factor 1-beta [archaeon]|nr:elongation factor 1-beta [archaeon]